MPTENKGKNKGVENLRPFKKGQSGNPSGRPKIPDDIKAMLKGATPDACRLLCETINNPNEKTELRVKCAEIVLDRVYGKPQQSVDLQADIDATANVSMIEGMSLAKRKKALDAALKIYESDKKHQR